MAYGAIDMDHSGGASSGEGSGPMKSPDVRSSMARWQQASACWLLGSQRHSQPRGGAGRKPPVLRRGLPLVEPKMTYT
jgi:hypothetical protein